MLFCAGFDQSFLRQGFQQTFLRTGKVFTLILTKFPNQLVGQLTVQVQKFRVLIPNAGSEAKLVPIISVKNVCLVAVQQGIELADKHMGGLVPVNALRLILCQAGENFMVILSDSFQK